MINFDKRGFSDFKIWRQPKKIIIFLCLWWITQVEQPPSQQLTIKYLLGGHCFEITLFEQDFRDIDALGYQHFHWFLACCSWAITQFFCDLDANLHCVGPHFCHSFCCKNPHVPWLKPKLLLKISLFAGHFNHFPLFFGWLQFNFSHVFVLFFLKSWSIQPFHRCFSKAGWSSYGFPSLWFFPRFYVFFSLSLSLSPSLSL
jgi:hypothetical protein